MRSTGTVHILDPGGSVVDTIDFDGVIGGIAIGPDQRIFAIVATQRRHVGALVIIDADGTRTRSISAHPRSESRSIPTGGRMSPVTSAPTIRRPH